MFHIFRKHSVRTARGRRVRRSRSRKGRGRRPRRGRRRRRGTAVGQYEVRAAIGEHEV
jgi:hypothetical protein